jgi:2-aminoethylphosphonate-pyruvate transaminase
MIDTAVILAAGLGSRLKKIISDRPKGFLILGKETIVEESILKLFNAGIKNIIIGTGFQSEKYEELVAKYPNILCVKNDVYQNSGSMYTLYNMRDRITSDFLLLESDLIFEKKGIEYLLKTSWPDVILTSGMTHSHDEVFVEINGNNLLVNMSKDPNQLKRIYSELVGISKISYLTFQKLCSFAENAFQKDLMLDYEYALVGIADDTSIYVKKFEKFLWYEIDDEKQLNQARNVIYPQIIRRDKDEKN